MLEEHVDAGDVTRQGLNDMQDCKLWLDVAIGANGATGMHSVLIRTFTNV